MFNSKLLAISAGVGFVLSFIAGLTAGVSFGMLILRGFLSGIVCAILALGLNLLFKKFLVVSSDDSVSSTPASGSVVDISVDDEDLPEDKNGPSFYVASDKKNASDLNDNFKSEKTEDNSIPLAKPEFEQSFKPVNDFSKQGLEAESQQTNQTQTSESTKPAHGTKKENITKSVALSKDDELDELPDISSFVPDFKQSDDIISDSQFATSSSSKSKTESHEDAQVIAQAIRTVLASDG